MNGIEPRACGLAGKSGKEFPYFGKTMTDLNALGGRLLFKLAH